MAVNLKPRLSGVYATYLKRRWHNSPIFHDWLYYDKPKISDRYVFDHVTYTVVGFSGVPPLGEIIMYEIKEVPND